MNSIFFIYRLIKKAEQRTDRLESLGKLASKRKLKFNLQIFPIAESYFAQRRIK